MYIRQFQSSRKRWLQIPYTVKSQFQAPYSTIPLSEFYSGFPTQQIPCCNVLLFVIVFSAPWNQAAAAAAAVSSERVPLLGFEWFRGFCACRRPHRPSSCRPRSFRFLHFLLPCHLRGLWRRSIADFFGECISLVPFFFVLIFIYFLFLLWGKWREGKGRRELNSVMRNC